MHDSSGLCDGRRRLEKISSPPPNRRSMRGWRDEGWAQTYLGAVALENEFRVFAPPVCHAGEGSLKFIFVFHRATSASQRGLVAAAQVESIRSQRSNAAAEP